MQAVKINNYFVTKIGSFPFSTTFHIEGTAVPRKLLSQKARIWKYPSTVTECSRKLSKQ